MNALRACLALLVWAGLASHGLAIAVDTTEELAAFLRSQATTPGPPVEVLVRGNVSLLAASGAPLPLRIAREVRVLGAGPTPAATELDLRGAVNAWQLAPGARVELAGVTLSNLALRPDGAPSPPPANLSVFAAPLWFFDVDRAPADAPQLRLRKSQLIVPYDEFMILQHAMVEASNHVGGKPQQVDMFYYFENLLAENSRGVVAAAAGVGAGPDDLTVSGGTFAGVELDGVKIGFEANHFPLITNRSRISQSNPAWIAGLGASGGDRGGGGGALPAWAAAVIAVGGAAALAVAALAVWLGLRARRSQHERLLDAGSLPLHAGGAAGSGSGSTALMRSSKSAQGARDGAADGALLAEEGLVVGAPRSQRASGSVGAAVRSRRSMEAHSGPLPSFDDDSRSGFTTSARSGSAAGGGLTSPGRGSSAAPGTAGGSAQVQQALHDAVAELNREVDDASLAIHEVLGQGAYGTVYRGTWRNLPVAVKTVVFQDRAAGGEKAQRRAISEAAITSSISHPNIVATLAYDLQPLQAAGGAALGSFQVSPAGRGGGGSAADEVVDWKLFLIQEFCAGGSLREAVDARTLYWDARARAPRLREILETALDVACGLEHLHAKNIVHGDLTPSNVLLAPGSGGGAGGAGEYVVVVGGGGQPPPAFGAASAPSNSSGDMRLGSGSTQHGAGAGAGGARMTAKIADFGLSIKMPEGATHVSNMRQGTPFYVAPEVQRRGNITKASDVYSLGVILWELYHSKRPYKASASRGHVPRRGFPFFSSLCPPQLALLAAACMNREPAARPGAARVRGELLSLLEGLNSAADADAAAAHPVIVPVAGAEGGGVAPWPGATAVIPLADLPHLAEAAPWPPHGPLGARGGGFGAGGAGTTATASDAPAVASGAAAATKSDAAAAAVPVAVAPAATAATAATAAAVAAAAVVAPAAAAPPGRAPTAGDDGAAPGTTAPTAAPAAEQPAEAAAAEGANAAASTAAAAAAAAEAADGGGDGARVETRGSFASSSDDDGGWHGYEETLTEDALPASDDDDSDDDKVDDGGGGGGGRGPTAAAV